MTTQLTHKGTQVAAMQPAGFGRLRGAWHRIRFTIQEMNYASRRAAELQAPWSVDKRWHSR